MVTQEGAQSVREMSHEELWADIVANYDPEPVVYFIGATNGLVKIGFATDLDDRLGQLVCGSPVPLRLLAWVNGGTRKLEGEYHQKFRRWRRHGEWFELCAEIEAEIERLKAILNA